MIRRIARSVLAEAHELRRMTVAFRGLIETAVKLPLELAALAASVAMVAAIAIGAGA